MTLVCTRYCISPVYSLTGLLFLNQSTECLLEMLFKIQELRENPTDRGFDKLVGIATKLTSIDFMALEALRDEPNGSKDKRP